MEDQNKKKEEEKKKKEEIAALFKPVITQTVAKGKHVDSVFPFLVFFSSISFFFNN